ncbi:MAG: hypothetical protein EBX66_04090 [Betaproteobacteria bacterium]|nr:hypothetical protein [Betaproteobacteria bacterium]
MLAPSARPDRLPTRSDTWHMRFLPKGFDTPGWIALYAPKGLPPAITQRLQDAVAKVLESPEAAQRFASAGAVPRYLGSAALTAYEESEIKKWGEAIRFSGARID